MHVLVAADTVAGSIALVACADVVVCETLKNTSERAAARARRRPLGLIVVISGTMRAIDLCFVE